MKPEDQPFYADLGSRFRQARTSYNLTQTQYGKLIGHSRSSIANIEGGRQSFPVHMLVVHAAALAVDPGWLLTGNQPPSDPQPPPRPVPAEALCRFAEDLDILSSRLRRLAQPSATEKGA